MEKPVKLPLPASFAWLCGFVGTLHTCIGVLAAGKQEVNAVVPITIPCNSADWGTDSSVPSHPFCYDISVTGMSDTDVVTVNVSPASATVALAAGLASTQSYAGKFRLRCKNIPEAAIQAEFLITNTAEYSAQTP
ncbi:MAG: hypothetical protein IJT94_08285 [Oscillibacter sp.]|nr:hypothetical protein [Oscillibacter sp.]